MTMAACANCGKWIETEGHACARTMSTANHSPRYVDLPQSPFLPKDADPEFGRALRRRCVKCGSDAAKKVEYREDWESHEEFLRMTCECGYSWTTPCLDAK